MTETTLPTASVTLPVSTLQLLRVRTLAAAALRQISLAQREAHWASADGRAALNAMWCGEQDAVFARMDSEREAILAEEAVAKTIGDAIIAAGCFLIDGKSDSRADRALVDIGVVQEFANADNIGEPLACYWHDTASRLRAFLTA